MDQRSPAQPPSAPPASRRWLARLGALPAWARWALAAATGLVLWYGVLGALLAGIVVDSGLRPRPAQLPAGGSALIGYAARLLDHEVNDRAFVPNDPFFYPTGLADRTAAYQEQLVATVAGVLAAAAGSGGAERMREAAALAATPPRQWWLAAGFPPVRASAERRYRRAIALLAQENAARAAAGTQAQPSAAAAAPEGQAALAAILLAIEAEAARGDAVIRAGRGGDARRQLAAARGTAQASAMLMRGVRDDQASVIRLSGRAARWGAALDALDAAAATDPLLVRRSDLIAAGYQLMVAAAAIRDILGTGAAP